MSMRLDSKRHREPAGFAVCRCLSATDASRRAWRDRDALRHRHGGSETAVAVKIHDGDTLDFTLGAEFTYEKATKRPAGYVGVEVTF